MAICLIKQDCIAEEAKITNVFNDEEEEKEDDTSHGEDNDDTKSVKKKEKGVF